MYHWQWVLRRLAAHDPARVADLVVEQVAGGDHPWRLDDGHAEVLVAAARQAPAVVMAVIGRAILNPATRMVFSVDVLHGVFEAVGVDAVRGWVDEHGPDTLRWIARHLASPSVGPGGEVVVPPVTRRLFTDREGDQEAFESFLSGRHSGAFFSPDDLASQTREAMAPFLAHPLRRVREWAEDEVRFAERHQAWLHEGDLEDDRI